MDIIINVLVQKTIFGHKYGSRPEKVGGKHLCDRAAAEKKVKTDQNSILCS